MVVHLLFDDDEVDDELLNVQHFQQSHEQIYAMLFLYELDDLVVEIDEIPHFYE